jgi:peptide/nickel transport system substrate-binding protein
MFTSVRAIRPLAVALALALAATLMAVALVGSPASRAQNSGPVTVVMGTAPDFLDPQEGYTTQSSNATWISYLGLYTYKHADGAAGGQVIPGLATALPQTSNNGKTYTMTLRKGLKYSNGKPVKASDFPYSIERSMKLNWGGKSFFTNYIAGASAFDKGKAKSISGITADDKTGKITIKLSTPYGAFLNILAFPSAGLVPTGTKMSNLSNNPPPGVGPYTIKNVVPNRSFQVVRNPSWTATTVPGVPPGKADINVRIASNTQTEAEQVLRNQTDVFDWADQIPPSLQPQVAAQAKGRYSTQPREATYYFFLNVKSKPFSSLQARQAVNYAVDRRALARLNGGNFTPTCYFLPAGLPGHPTSPCPYGDPNKPPNMAKARQLVQQSGMKGEAVTVWGENRSPRKEFTDYYTNVLNQIGFKAKSKIVSDAQYFPTIGNLKLNPQTGFDDWNQDYPNPSDFYLLLDAKTIQPTNNFNHSQVNDPHIQKELAALNKVPTERLNQVANRWRALDEYVARKAYQVSYGQLRVPKFTSDRIDYGAVQMHPLYGTDWSTLALKNQ